MKVRNTFIIFIVSGFWHGANWTFIVWGALNAIYFLPLLLLKKNRVNTDNIAQDKFLPSLREFLNMLITFALTVLAWIFFRADSIGHAWSYLTSIFSDSLFAMPSFSGTESANTTAILIIIFIIIEWLGRESEFAIEKLDLKLNKPLRWVFYFVIILLMFIFTGEEQQFIYFQF